MEYLYKWLRLYSRAPIIHPQDQVERFCWAVFIYLVLAVIIIQVGIAIVGYIRKKKSDEPCKENSKKRFLRNLIINLAIVILFFACWEFAVDRYYSHYSQKHTFINPLRRWRLEPGLKNHFYCPANHSGTVTIIDSNSEGLRNEEVPIKKEQGEIRILCLGDSWTAGQSVKENETFVRQLEKKLQEEYPDKKIRVINAGMFGYSIFHAYYLFKDLRSKYKPDILILCGFNDIANSEIKIYEEAINLLGSLGFIKEFLNKSLVYLCLKKTVYRFKDKREFKGNEKCDVETAKKLYAKYSNKIYKKSEKHGITTIVFDKVSPISDDREFITTPEDHSYCKMPNKLSDNWDDKQTQNINRRFRGIHFYSIEPENLSNPEFLHKHDLSHPSSQGHKSIAEALFHIIKQGSYI
ncbi:MAG: SGNH/GDSL hydrolase family protein [Candidatus Eremiobacteraeota bacterium]|nr:SGNH/GDSL hydrolase family protein [Candidatus Eremiobacteraeota bacterium]